MKSTTDPLGAEEARHQHVAVRHVHLLVLGLVEAGDLEEASFVFVEKRREDAWGVELRKAAPVDRTVHAHQRDRVQVTNYAVGLDRLIGHFLSDLSKSRIEMRLGSFSASGPKISIPSCPGVGGAGSILGENRVSSPI